MSQIFKEFKEFAIKGNLIDLGVGIIIGTAFSKIVSSFVNDIIMAPLGFILGKANFTNYFVTLSGGEYATLQAAKEAGAITLNYGSFITAIVDFLIVALILFLFVRQINRFRRRHQETK